MEGRQPTYDELLAENAALKVRVEQLTTQVEQLTTQVQQLTAQVEALTKLLEEKTRSGKRQAAPFSKGPPKNNPQTPGRKPGEDYGQHHRRAIPDHIDETYDVPLPAACPECGSRELIDEATVPQWQTDLPTRPIVRQFDIHCGHCCGCGQRVQGRHALQTSDATGAAASQFGANVHAAIAILNKELGLPHGKIARLMRLLFDIRISRSTSCRSVLRTAARCEPAYEQILAHVRGSPVIKVDETGWKLPGQPHWLHGVGSPLYVVEGAVDGNWPSIELMEKSNTNPQVQFFQVPGYDHFSVIAPVVDLLAKQIVAGQVQLTPAMFEGL